MKWNRLITLISMVLIHIASLVGCATMKQDVSPEDAQKAQFETAYLEILKGLEESGLEESDLEDTANKLKTLHEAHPQYAGPLVNMGIIAYKQKRLEQAQAYFDQALAINPKHKQVLNYLGVLSREAGRFGEAEVFYRQAIELDPKYKSAIRNLGVLLDLYRGRLEEALALYEQYQSLLDSPDAQVKDWIFDTKQRLK